MSEIRANTISDAAGTGPVTLTKQSAAKAWVNFDASGTVAARDSLNLSSLTDNAQGDFTVNFSSAFATVGYVFSAFAGNNGATSIGRAFATNAAVTTSSLRFGDHTSDDGVSHADDAVIMNAAHGDLA